MADILDPGYVNIQMIKADKNNDDNLKIIEIISPSEQSDVLTTDPTSDNLNDNNDNHGLSSTSDNNPSKLSNDELEASKTIEIPSNLYKDFSGIDTESFITTTLRNNPKDRTLLLMLEKLFQEFIQMEDQTSHQFQAMNSYERMIVHRVAAFFGLDHNVDKNGQSIIVTKTANTRIPNLSFQNFIPTDELPNGAIININSSNENSTRRINHRNNNNNNHKNFHQQTSITTKSSNDRTNQYNESRERIATKTNRKQYQQQQRFNTNQHMQQTNIQPSNHFINARTQSIYPTASNSYYPQQSVDHDFKQQATNSPMYNYVPMISPTSFHHGNSIPVPILLHQQPTGQLQYVFPTHSYQQQQQPSASVSSDGQYMPVYRSDVVPSVIDNNPYAQPPYVQLYPNHPYPPTPQTTFIQPAPSFMIPPATPPSIQYATNQLAALNIQSQSKSYIQSSNGLNPGSNYQQYRQNRPLNPSSHHPDKQISPNETDIKSTNDQISHSGQIQEKN